MKDYENIMLYSDLDGTLLNSEGRVSEENLEALRKFLDLGGLFGIATGRNQLNSTSYLQDISLTAPCILYNGGGLFDFSSGEYLSYHELSKERLIPFLKSCLQKYQAVMIQIFCPDMSYFISPEEFADRYIYTIHQPCKFTSLEDLENQPWIKVLLCGNAQVLSKLSEEITETRLQQEIDWVYSSDIYLEVLPKGISKGRALSEIRNLMGAKYRIYAVGDYYNDIEMIQAADVGIATRNAVEELKEIADIITVSNDESAIADIVNNIINRN